MLEKLAHQYKLYKGTVARVFPVRLPIRFHWQSRLKPKTQAPLEPRL